MTNYKHINIIQSIKCFAAAIPDVYNNLMDYYNKGMITEDEVEKQFSKYLTEFLSSISESNRELKHWEEETES